METKFSSDPVRSPYFKRDKIIHKQRNTWLYAIEEYHFNNVSNEWQRLGVKIGYSKNYNWRRSNLNVGTTNNLIVAQRLLCRNGKETEALIHSMFQDRKVRGEWFDLSQEEVKNIFTIAQFFEKNV